MTPCIDQIAPKISPRTKAVLRTRGSSPADCIPNQFRIIFDVALKTARVHLFKRSVSRSTSDIPRLQVPCQLGHIGLTDTRAFVTDKIASVSVRHAIVMFVFLY